MVDAMSSGPASEPASPCPCRGTVIALSPAERGWYAPPLSILRDVQGPDFHGPSSSHTAGPQQIALAVYRSLGGQPDRAAVALYNSLASTGDGHRTPVAVIAGLLGLRTTDPRTPMAPSLAEAAGLRVDFGRVQRPDHHANTLVITASRGSRVVRLRGVSLGGGLVEVEPCDAVEEVHHAGLH